MTVEQTTRPVVCVALDGPIHKYTKGWYTGDLYDDAVPGLFPWLHRMAAAGFALVICSPRAASYAGRDQMAKWFKKQAIKNGGNMIPPLGFSDKVPKEALVTIDDRVMCFGGDWSAPELQPGAIAAFRPWTEKIERQRTRNQELAEALAAFVREGWEARVPMERQSPLIRHAMAVLRDAAPQIHEEVWHHAAR